MNQIIHKSRRIWIVEIDGVERARFSSNQAAKEWLELYEKSNPMKNQTNSCRAFEPVPGYRVSESMNHSPSYPKWILWKDNQIISRHKTKREANRAIPMREMKFD